jgi:predicted SAM-dependent methyltransferase
MRLNLGCGAFPLEGFTSIDADPAVQPDVVATVPPLPYPDGAVAEIYMGHLLEHFDYEDGQALLRECYRVLMPGGRLGVVVPDTRAIMRLWLAGVGSRWEYPAGHWRCVDDLDEVCAMFLYSTVQPSHHQWSYDLGTLARALARAGLQPVAEIDRYRDPRLSNGGAWYQCGWDAERLT